jgi:hypothetical protein
MLTIFSTEEVGFFGAGPPPVIFFSLLYSVKADLAFDVKFLHWSFISFTLLGATPKALILLRESEKSAQGKKSEFLYVGGVHTSERSGKQF